MNSRGLSSISQTFLIEISSLSGELMETFSMVLLFGIIEIGKSKSDHQPTQQCWLKWRKKWCVLFTMLLLTTWCRYFICKFKFVFLKPTKLYKHDMITWCIYLIFCILIAHIITLIESSAIFLPITMKNRINFRSMSMTLLGINFSLLNKLVMHGCDQKLNDEKMRILYEARVEFSPFKLSFTLWLKRFLHERKLTGRTWTSLLQFSLDIHCLRMR